jgi:flagellar biosynthesis activator protein FlaF
MHNATQAYSHTAQVSSSPREIEAQTLLKAARQLQEVRDNWAGPDRKMGNALLFNRRLWSIFIGAAETNDNPQPVQIRQNIVNIGVFVLKQTIEMQMDPDPAKLKSLIDINCNLAAGLSGRA